MNESSPSTKASVAKPRRASLSGFSANFVYLERADLPLHTFKILELRTPRPIGIEDIVGGAKRAVQLAPPLGWSLHRSPGDLYHPRWETAPHLDLSSRVHASPHDLSGESDLDTLVGRLASEALPVDRYVWDVTFARWADDPTRTVLVIRLHHALADGVAAQNMLEHVITHWSSPAPEVTTLSPSSAGSSHSMLEALGARIAGLRRLPALLWRTVRGWIRMRKLWRKLPKPQRGKTLFGTPHTSLDQDGAHHRSFHHFELDFSAIRTIKGGFDCTVGDVFLNLAAGGLRAYFQRLGEAVSRTLVASVPVSIDSPNPDGPLRLAGNRLSHIPIRLHTHVVDDRLRQVAIARDATIAKRLHAAFGTKLLRAWADLSWRVVLLAAFSVVRRLKRPPVNVIVSSVPGPKTVQSVGSTELERLFSVGPLLDRIGLNITAWSYRGRLAVSILANTPSHDDLTSIEEGMRTTLRNLTQSLAIRAGTATPAGQMESMEGLATGTPR